MVTSGSDSPSAQLRTLQLIHLMLVIAQIAFIGAALFVRDPRTVENMGGNDTTLLLTVLVLIFSSQALRRSLLTRAKKQESLHGKLEGYRTAYIVFMALREMLTIVLAVGYLMGYFGTAALFWAAFSILVFALMRPTRSRMAQELELAPAEVEG